jgi:hypothetical protein
MHRKEAKVWRVGSSEGFCSRPMEADMQDLIRNHRAIVVTAIAVLVAAAIVLLIVYSGGGGGGGIY